MPRQPRSRQRLSNRIPTWQQSSRPPSPPIRRERPPRRCWTVERLNSSVQPNVIGSSIAHAGRDPAGRPEDHPGDSLRSRAAIPCASTLRRNASRLGAGFPSVLGSEPQRLPCAATRCAWGCARSVGASSRSQVGPRSPGPRSCSLGGRRRAIGDRALRGSSTRRHGHLVSADHMFIAVILICWLAVLVSITGLCRAAALGDSVAGESASSARGIWLNGSGRRLSVESTDQLACGPRLVDAYLFTDARVFSAGEHHHDVRLAGESGTSDARPGDRSGGERVTSQTASTDRSNSRLVEPKLMPPRIQPGMLRRARLLRDARQRRRAGAHRGQRAGRLRQDHPPSILVYRAARSRRLDNPGRGRRRPRAPVDAPRNCRRADRSRSRTKRADVS